MTIISPPRVNHDNKLNRNFYAPGAVYHGKCALCETEVQFSYEESRQFNFQVGYPADKYRQVECPTPGCCYIIHGTPQTEENRVQALVTTRVIPHLETLNLDQKLNDEGMYPRCLGFPGVLYIIYAEKYEDQSKEELAKLLNALKAHPRIHWIGRPSNTDLFYLKKA